MAHNNLAEASAGSSAHDFDFLEGKWKVHNIKLKERLANCTEWIEFPSELHMRKTLNGMGNVENYYATFDGEPFEGMAIRLFNPTSKLWTVYWIDTGSCVMDEYPVSGSFENGIGKLYSRQKFKEIDILVLYQWDSNDPEQPIWSQAFSMDEGQTWEWNWKMILQKIL